MNTYSLDTDILTKLLRRHPGNRPVVDRFREEVRRNSLFIMCPVVYYELRRELVLKRAATQLVAFEKLAELMAWKEFNASIWDEACNLWSVLRTRGRSHNDADVLIAAHALHFGAVLISGNVAHFQETGVPLENWNGPLHG
jgi:predicted nucleic acid-binding protein